MNHQAKLRKKAREALSLTYKGMEMRIFYEGCSREERISFFSEWYRRSLRLKTLALVKHDRIIDGHPRGAL